MDTTLHYLGVALGWAFLVFWIWMLVDCIKNEEDNIVRVTWALVMFFIPPLCVPIYYFYCYRERQRDKKRNEKTTAS